MSDHGDDEDDVDVGSGMETEKSTLRRMMTGGSSMRSLVTNRMPSEVVTAGGLTETDDLPLDSSASIHFATRKSSFFTFTKKKGAGSAQQGVERPPQRPGEGTMNASNPSQMAMVSSMGQPSILLTPYGTDWALDIFALPQNAIRHEVDNLYTILMAIAQKKQMLTMKDLDRLTLWLTMFRSFVEKYLDLQEMLIYPWIERESKPIVGDLSRQKRGEARNNIFKLLQIVYDTPKMAPGKYPRPLLWYFYPELRKNVDKLVSALLTHLATIENTLPQLLKRIYQPKDSQNMRKDIVDGFHSNPYKREHVVLLGKWLQLPQYRRHYRHWKSENIRGTRAVSFQEWETLYDRGHGSIVRRFHSQVYSKTQK